MKNQPLDSLTKQDRYNIRKYIYLFNNCKCGPLDIVLGEWNYAKRRLYHAFGNQLRVKKKIKLKKDSGYIARQLQSIYEYNYLTNYYDLEFYERTIKNKKLEKDFYEDFFLYIVDYPNINNDEKIYILNMFNPRYIIDGYIDYDFKLEHYSFSVRKGAKTIRTIQKCIKALSYDNAKLFNEWRNDINTANSNNINEATLVLSINPIDFMTMSDNQCNWTSCMSWINPGCHSAGTIEMMNSNVAVVAYLEAKKNFNITLDEDNKLIMPNKSWRSLIYCHKQMILTGKSYPYYKEEISLAALDFMREIVEKSFGWTYKFKNQQYKDIKNFHSNSFLRNHCSPNYHSKSKKIVIYTDGMYNDMIEDTSFKYWCCRNVTKGLRINLSGKNTCVCCGQRIEPYDYDYNYEEYYLDSEKICEDCSIGRKCPICGVINYSDDNRYHLCSEECKDDALVFPGQNRIISRTKFLSKIDSSFLIFAKNKDCYEKISNCLADSRDLILHTTSKSLDSYEKRQDFIKEIFNERHIKHILAKEGFICGNHYIIKTVPNILMKIDIFNIDRISYRDFISVTRNIKIFNMIRFKNSSFYLFHDNDKGLILNKEVTRVLNEIDNLSYYRYNERRDYESSNSLINGC